MKKLYFDVTMNIFKLFVRRRTISGALIKHGGKHAEVVQFNFGPFLFLIFFSENVLHSYIK